MDNDDWNFAATNRFAPKLTFADRCALYIIHRQKRVSLTTLAKYFKVNTRTASAICNPTHPYYKTVRAEAERLGPDAMFSTYVNETHREGIRKIILDGEHRVTKKYESVGLTEPSRAHNSKQGTFVKNGFEVSIEWVNGPSSTGWHWTMPGMIELWRGDADDKPFNTSKEALDYATRNL